MTAKSVLQRLKGLGSEQTRKTLIRHGATRPLFGVKIQDLKKIVPEIRGDAALISRLFHSGNSDAMYLACLAADARTMTAVELDDWVSRAPWKMIAAAVAAVAAEGPHGWERGLRWIDSDQELVSSAGWTALAGVAAILPDEKLDLPTLRRLLARIGREIHRAPNDTRYMMNSFLISVGAAVGAMTEQALTVARKVGVVEVDMLDTACKVPSAVQSIEKIRSMGRIGRKRASVRC